MLNFNILAKALLAGFFSGITIGRRIKYVNRIKHIHRLRNNKEQQQGKFTSRIRLPCNEKEQYFSMEQEI
jgi:hypothetical protein